MSGPMTCIVSASEMSLWCWAVLSIDAMIFAYAFSIVLNTSNKPVSAVSCIEKQLPLDERLLAPCFGGIIPYYRCSHLPRFLVHCLLRQNLKFCGIFLLKCGTITV